MAHHTDTEYKDLDADTQRTLPEPGRRKTLVSLCMGLFKNKIRDISEVTILLSGLLIQNFFPRKG